MYSINFRQGALCHSVAHSRQAHLYGVCLVVILSEALTSLRRKVVQATGDGEEEVRPALSLGKTWILTVSFMMLANELLKKSPKHALGQSDTFNPWSGSSTPNPSTALIFPIRSIYVMKSTSEKTAARHPELSNLQQTKSLVIIQSSVLRLFGFLPYCHEESGLAARQSSITKYFCSHALPCLAVAVLIGNAFFGAITTIRMFGVIIMTNRGQTAGWLRYLLYYSPDLSSSIRTCCVLVVIFAKRNSWTALVQQSIELTALLFPNSEAEHRVYAKLNRLSVVCFIASFASYILWYSISTVEFAAGRNSTSLTEIRFYPLSFALIQTEYVILDVFFRAVPFVFSQQVHFCGVCLVVILSEALTGLRREIVQATASCGTMTNELVQRWSAIHVNMMRFLEEVSEMFQLIFLVVYVSDFVNVIGSLAFVLSSDLVTSNWSYVHYAGTFAIFGLYASLLTLPLIQVFEKSSSLPDKIYFLTVAVKDHNEKSTTDYVSYWRLLDELRQFEKSCRHHPLVFTGCKVISFTRELLLGTWTLTVSFMILANELLK
ncbi:hypothetical protein BV898_18635 [Hypsibius exemplaris]|uniref:Gustatory receptor n=1 Tax=Hypsibius exemplaris TaxID=2072580 RepID=A0A9X6NJ87_HYPEX|nr:hypothetical protein BV898_18635 [Hypsibius exemplaris]